MSSQSRLILAAFGGLILGLAVSVATRVVAQGPALPAAAPAEATIEWQDARLLAEVLQRVHENYVNPVDDHALMHSAVRGLVESLDEHSSFLERKDFEAMQITTSGEYPGIGIALQTVPSGIIISECTKGSPAELAGLRIGDLITEVEGAAIGPGAIETAIAKLRGQAGTVVHLTVQRVGSSQALKFSIERITLELPSVSAELLAPGIGYLRISNFSENTASELETELAKLPRAANGRLAGLVIDLRNNPGGVVDAAARIADDFLESGLIVSAEGRTPDARFRIEAHPGDISDGAPISVIVNGGSASAAEILAAALHDNHRARLIGRRTYGKGSVQTIMPLADGEGLKLTTSLYYTPAGISINGTGITPDVVLTGAEQPPALMDSAGVTPTLARRDVAVARAITELHAAAEVH
jgi:carboxyl-terminal processing protease